VKSGASSPSRIAWSSCVVGRSSVMLRVNPTTAPEGRPRERVGQACPRGDGPGECRRCRAVRVGPSTCRRPSHEHGPSDTSRGDFRPLTHEHDRHAAANGISDFTISISPCTTIGARPSDSRRCTAADGCEQEGLARRALLLPADSECRRAASLPSARGNRRARGRAGRRGGAVLRTVKAASRGSHDTYVREVPPSARDEHEPARA